MEIRNYEEVVEKLVEMLADLEVEAAAYQTDIYLYTREDGTAYLDTYINVGGNSWKNDDHIFLYADGPHYSDPRDEGVTEEEIRDSLDMMAIREKAWTILDEAGIE